MLITFKLGRAFSLKLLSNEFMHLECESYVENTFRWLEEKCLYEPGGMRLDV